MIGGTLRKRKFRAPESYSVCVWLMYWVMIWSSRAGQEEDHQALPTSFQGSVHKLSPTMADTHIDTDPNSKKRVRRRPLYEARIALRNALVLVHLINERQHGRSVRLYKRSISGRAAGGKVVRKNRTRVELRDVEVDPVVATSRGPARKWWVSNWVGRRGQLLSRIEAGLRVAVAAVLYSSDEVRLE